MDKQIDKNDLRDKKKKNNTDRAEKKERKKGSILTTNLFRTMEVL